MYYNTQNTITMEKDNRLQLGVPSGNNPNHIVRKERGSFDEYFRELMLQKEKNKAKENTKEKKQSTAVKSKTKPNNSNGINKSDAL